MFHVRLLLVPVRHRETGIPLGYPRVSEGVSLPRVSEGNLGYHRVSEGNVTKFAPHKALKLIAGGKLTFDEKVVIHLVDAPQTPTL